ncbi:CDP-alcohol phosphatidyltransferase family protein [Dysosmobacter sp.]
MPEGGAFIQYIANGITILRVIFAVWMLLATPFSAAFWACYLLAGASDLLDGFAARALHQQSDLGAKLDSAADVVFAAAIAIFALANVKLPLWMWGGAICAGVLRLAAYGTGLAKYHTFSALHTCGNKVTGALVFAFPLLHSALGLTAAGVILLTAALASSVEELVITVKSKELNRDDKGMYMTGKFE